MGRKARSSLSPGVYHVLNRGINRIRILESDDDRTRFLDLLKEYAARFHVRILHWVVMSNHYHLVVDVDGPKDLTKFVWGLQRKYTARHHRVRREAGQDACGFLWQGRFKSVLVETRTSMLPLARYVERNPVRAGLADLPWDYAWSSACAYALGKDDGLTSCESNGEFLAMGRTEDERHEAWQKYLTAPDAAKDEPRFKAGVRAVGSDSFQARVLMEKGRPSYGHKGRKSTTTQQ